MKVYEKKSRGITLIALVITIILLLILAGITITQLTESGLFEKAKIAKEESIKAQIKEEIRLELIDIVTEYTSKEKNLTNIIVKQELENRLSEIEVLEDLTGTYKGYKYKIDDNFDVFIIDGNENNFINIDIDKKVGTSYITINVQASSTQGNIVKYEYIIDEVTYPSEKAAYTIENLEPESTHTIKVVAIDDKENRKTSNIVNVKTEQRTYLYNEGIDNTELTGGWIGKSLQEFETDYGIYDKGTDYLYVKNGSTNNFGSSNYWPSWITNNEIDLTPFCKIVIEGEFKGYKINETDSILCVFGAYDDIPYNNINQKHVFDYCFDTRTHMEVKFKELDKTERYYIAISAMNSHNDLHSELTIKKVWLEK